MHRNDLYRGYLTGAVIAAVLITNVPVIAQPTQHEHARIASGIDETVRVLQTEPRLKKLSPHTRKQLVEFIVRNTLFAMAHEMGHGLINELNMPVLGREEDAADSFAIVNALKMGSTFSERVLEEAAKGLVLSAKHDEKEGNAPAFYDEHGLDPQRAYNIVCFMYGSNPAKFKQLANNARLPEERQKSCVYDYKNAAWSFEEMLKTHQRAPDQPKIEINVQYEVSKKYATVAHALRTIGLLDMLAEHAADRWAWPHPLKIEAR